MGLLLGAERFGHFILFFRWLGFTGLGRNGSMRSGRVLSCALIAALSLLLSARAHAAFTGLINIDFGGPQFTGAPQLVQSGPAAIGAAGDVWNAEDLPLLAGGNQTASNLALVASDGSATAVQLAFNLIDGGSYQAPGNGFTGGPLEPLMTDYFYAHGGGTVTLSGLTPGGAYDLYVYGDSNFDKSLRYTVNGVNQDLLNVVSASTLIQGNNFAKFAAIADGSGNLVVALDQGPIDPNFASFEGLISGLQIQSASQGGPGPTPAPLPPGVLMGVVGAGAAAVWRMRLARAGAR